MYPIRPVPKRYPWGSYDRLQAMFASCSPEPIEGPLAEMWFSGHPQSPSLVLAPDEVAGGVAGGRAGGVAGDRAGGVAGDRTGSVTGDRAGGVTGDRTGGSRSYPANGGLSLPDMIRGDPERMVGARVSEWFGPVMPFLLKVISARIPLSLQVHPVGFEARRGFNAENAAGVPADAPERSFKDPVAKSEMVVALGSFHASVGFAPVASMLANLRLVDHPVARTMARALEGGSGGRGDDAKGFERADAMMPMAATVWPASSRRVFRAFHAAVSSCGVEGLKRALRDAALRATNVRSHLAFEHALAASEAFGDDASVLCLLMMNPLLLHDGESVFIPAGTAHVYIHGTAVEIMTNSDNVLRAGMTQKHKDIPHLLHSLDCRPAAPVDPSKRAMPVPQAPDVLLYQPDITEFMLAYGHVGVEQEMWGAGARLFPPAGRRPAASGRGWIDQRGPRILLCVDGSVACTSRLGSATLTSGQAVFIPAEEAGVTVAAVHGQGSPDASVRTQPYGSFVLASTQL